MPIPHQIDSNRRRILATATGAIGQRDLFAHHREMASRPEWTEYDELLDVSWIDGLLDIHLDNLNQLAVESARSDGPDNPSRLVIVAPQNLIFGLCKMYVSLRKAAPGASREVAAFRSRKEAERWLDFSQTTAPSSGVCFF